MSIEYDIDIIENRFNEARLFTRQFGTFTKSDYETLMFTIYMDLIDDPKNDYDISRELGITESKVRNLRVKSQLLYPKDLNLNEELTKAIEKGFFDPDNMTLTITLQDPNIQRLVLHLIEQEYGNVQFTLNPKHLKLPIESYVLLSMEVNKEKTKDDALSTLNHMWLSESENRDSITKEKLLQRVWKNRGSIKTAMEFLYFASTKGYPFLKELLTKIQQYS